MKVFSTFPRFETLLRGSLRENPGAKTNENKPQNVTKRKESI
jgi:hypothetical protein